MLRRFIGYCVLAVSIFVSAPVFANNAKEECMLSQTGQMSERAFSEGWEFLIIRKADFISDLYRGMLSKPAWSVDHITKTKGFAMDLRSYVSQLCDAMLNASVKPANAKISSVINSYTGFLKSIREKVDSFYDFYVTEATKSVQQTEASIADHDNRYKKLVAYLAENEPKFLAVVEYFSESHNRDFFIFVDTLYKHEHSLDNVSQLQVQDAKKRFEKAKEAYIYYIAVLFDIYNV